MPVEGKEMAKAYIGTGTAEDGVIRLDDGEGLPAGRVRVFVEPEQAERVGSFFDIRPSRHGKSADELLRELRSLRDEWGRTGT